MNNNKKEVTKKKRDTQKRGGWTEYEFKDKSKI
jgi:hypothetical protein